jgi:hypothetical protein
MKRDISISLGLVVGLLLALPAAAQLNGHNLRGDYGLSAGSQPPAGLWLGAIYVNLDIDSLRDRNGDQLELPIDLDYVRVLEIPTPHWTAYDAKFLKMTMPEGTTMQLQDRAYSSAIWYTP